MAELTPEQKDRFLVDLESIVADAESLLRRAGSRKKPGVERASAELRGGLRATVRKARATKANLDGSVVVHAKTFGSALDDFARHEPWLVMGVTAGVGLLLGLVIGRSRR